MKKWALFLSIFFLSFSGLLTDASCAEEDSIKPSDIEFLNRANEFGFYLGFYAPLNAKFEILKFDIKELARKILFSGNDNLINCPDEGVDDPQFVLADAIVKKEKKYLYVTKKIEKTGISQEYEFQFLNNLGLNVARDGVKLSLFGEKLFIAADAALINTRSEKVYKNEIINRFCSPGWIAFHCCLLALVVFHGLNGLWGILVDFNLSKRTNLFFKQALWFVGVILFGIGLYILIWFATKNGMV